MDNYEKIIKDLKGIQVNPNNKTEKKEFPGFLIDALDILFTNTYKNINEFNQNQNENTKIDKNVNNKENLKSNLDKRITPEQIHKGFNINNKTLSTELLIKKESGENISLNMLTKDVLNELLINEKLSVETVAYLFDVEPKVVLYGMTLTGIKITQEDEKLEKNVQHILKLQASEYEYFLNNQIDNILEMSDDTLKQIAIENFIIMLSTIAQSLNIIKSKNQLVLVKKDKNNAIYFHVYSLDLQEFVTKYNLLKINWTM